MVRGCGNKCMKYALFLFNLAFLIVGLALLVTGIFVLIKAKDFQDVFETPDGVSILIIIIGICVSVVSFFGCCGAVNEGKCMLYTYALVVIIAMILEIIAAILLLVYMSLVTDNVARGFERGMSNYKPQDNKHLYTNIIDNIQRSLKCCGAKHATDWAKFNPRMGSTIPVSCCIDSPNLASNTCVKPDFETGCISELDKVIKYIIGFMSGILLAAALTQLVAASFACSVAKAAD